MASLEIPNESRGFVSGFLKGCKDVLPYSKEYRGYDFTGASNSLLVNVIVAVPGGLFLALRRTSANDSGVGLLNNVAGYMQGQGGPDDIADTVRTELVEEADIGLAEARLAKVGQPFEVNLPNRTLHVVPGLVVFDFVPEVNLNQEHDRYDWLTRPDFLSRPRIPAVDTVFAAMLG